MNGLYGARSAWYSALLLSLVFAFLLCTAGRLTANTPEYLLNNIELKLMSIIEYSDRLESELINSRIALKQSEAFANELKNELDQLSHELAHWKSSSDAQLTRVVQLQNIAGLLETRLSKLSERYENTVVEYEKLSQKFQAELRSVRSQRDLMIGAAVVAAILAVIGFIL